MKFKNIINQLLNSTNVWLIYFFGFVPAGYYFYKALLNKLGPDPLIVLEHSLGEWALNFLIAVLSIRPINDFLKINLVKFRRALGLIAFGYAVLHVSTYIILDRQLLWDEIIKDITKRPYIIFGGVAFFLLVPLAVTSNFYSIKRLGPKYWKALHRLVYFAALASIAHYILSVKSWPIQPIIYSLVIISLIVYRLKLIWFFKKLVNNFL